MSGKEKYKREIAILFPYVSKKEKAFLHNFMQNIEDADYIIKISLRNGAHR